MIPECQRRLAKAFDELKILLETEGDLNESEEYISAKKILEEAEAQLPN
jgi:tubulin-specific chaperone A